MSILTGKEALIALASGQKVEFLKPSFGEWELIHGLPINVVLEDSFSFRLKPRTITINGIKVPAPFEPKDGDKTYYLNDGMTDGYRESEHLEHFEYHFGAWRTEEEIRQVVAALRQVFGGV